MTSPVGFAPLTEDVQRREPPDTRVPMALSDDDRRLFSGIVTDLVNSTTKMGPMLLLTAGLRPEEWERLRKVRVPSPTTNDGKRLSKAQIARRLLEGLPEPRIESMLGKMARTAAEFSSYELSPDRRLAEATVKAARAWLVLAEAAEAKRAEILGDPAFAERRVRFERERETLLGRFDALVRHTDAQERGLLLERLLNDTCRVYSVKAVEPFVRDPNGVRDQIDGGIEVDNVGYTVECKWTERLTSRHVVDGLMKKMERSHDPAMWGILISIQGWASTVEEAIRVDRLSKNVLLVDGVDLRGVLAGHIHLAEMVRRKHHRARWKSEPFVPVGQLLNP